MVRKLSKGCFGGQRFSDFIQVYRRLMITLHNIVLCKERIDMTPEEKARVKIDQWFKEAGWQVVNRDEYEPTMTAVAVREGLLKGNKEADYFMFINGKAVGVLEAKREDVDVSSDIVSDQVTTYARSVPNCYQTWMKPLPMLYKSNGKVVLFEDYRKTDTDWDELNRIHTPREIVRLLGISDPFAGLPTLRKRKVCATVSMKPLRNWRKVFVVDKTVR